MTTGPIVPVVESADKILPPSKEAMDFVSNVKIAGAQVVRIVAQTSLYKIKDEESYIASWALIEQHDEAIRNFESWFDPFINMIHKLHRYCVSIRGQLVSPVEDSKRRLLSQRFVFKQEKDRLARIKAEKEAEVQRKKQAAELEKEAAKLKRAGDKEAAKELTAQAANLPMPAVTPKETLQKQAGEVERPRWDFTVTNYDMVPVEYKTLSSLNKTEREIIDSKIRKVVNALGDTLKIPGVEVKRSTDPFSRSVRP